MNLKETKNGLDGWGTTTELYNTKRFSASVRLDDFKDSYSNEKIKYDLCQELIKDVYNSRIIHFSKEKHPGFEQYAEYRAEFTCVDKKFNQMFEEKDVFRVKGKEFSTEQITEAILKTFPEEFL